jgi:quinol monooxygenase YgiN
MSQAEQKDFIDELRSRISKMLDTLDQEAPISATVTFKVIPEKESEFIRNADALTEATRKLPGCQSFVYQKAIQTGPPGGPIGYAINESWETVRSFKRQWNSEHLEKFQHSVLGLLPEGEIPDLQFYYGSGYLPTAHTVPVPKTGQKRCWDTAGTFIQCAGTGQDGDAQAGAAWPSPRFVDNGNGTVTDKLTDLIWLKDADFFGEVTWEQALQKAQHLAGGSGGLNDGSKAGDWRLPNIREIQTVIDYGTGHPILPAGHPFKNAKMSIYWTSTTLTAAPTLAWMTTLGIGPTVFDLKINDNRMWPVRGTGRVAQTGQKVGWDAHGQPVADLEGTGQDGETQAGVPAPNPRFVDNQDGTVTDRLTGLVWLKNADAFGLRTWDQALAACNSLSMFDHGLGDGSAPGDWRLPNIKEIESLVDYGNVGPSIPAGHPFANVRPSSYWTSTSVANAPTQAMFIILGVGPVIFENKEHPFFVWPVRDARPAR